MSPYLTDTPPSHEERWQDDLTSLFPHIHDDPATLTKSLDPFTITAANGFLPLQPPRIELPPQFQPLIDIAEKLPVVKVDGTPGLLATYQVGPTIDNHELPDLNADIDTLIAADGKPDLASVTAAFRDYAFIASAYLLEPCWERWSNGLEGYGLGRQMLPKCIAGPLVKTAKM